MIRWIREKFKGSLIKKHRKLYRQLQETDFEINKLTKRKKRMAAQLALIGSLKSMVEGKNKQEPC